MKLSDTSQLDDLMDETAYNEYVKESEDEWGIPRTYQIMNIWFV
jgi:hypothetical protein